MNQDAGPASGGPPFGAGPLPPSGGILKANTDQPLAADAKEEHAPAAVSLLASGVEKVLSGLAWLGRNLLDGLG